MIMRMFAQMNKASSGAQAAGTDMEGAAGDDMAIVPKLQRQPGSAEGEPEPHAAQSAPPG